MLNPGAGNPDAANQAVAEHELPAHALAVLKTHCYRCHGEGGSVEGGFNVALNRQRLVSQRYLVPGDAAASPLFQRLNHGEMPPHGQSPRPGETEIATLRHWIDAGARDATAPPRHKFITPDQMLSWIAADLRQASSSDRLHWRYLTFSHLANTGHCDDELRTYHNAIDAVFNGGTAGPTRTNPQPIDPSGTVLRIDLRDCGWSPADWQAIAAAEPYAIEPAGGLAAEIRELSQSPLSYVRGDWLVTAALNVSLGKQAGRLPAAKLDAGDPRIYVMHRFERALDLTLAAAELGLETADLRVRVSRAPSHVSDLLTPVLTPGGSIKRDAFAKSFGQLAAGLGLGTAGHIAPQNGRAMEVTRRPLPQR